jgi:hypothetical protein
VSNGAPIALVPLELSRLPFHYDVTRYQLGTFGKPPVNDAFVLNEPGLGFAVRRRRTDPGVRLDVGIGGGQILQDVRPGDIYRVPFERLFLWKHSGDFPLKVAWRNETSVEDALGRVELVLFRDSSVALAEALGDELDVGGDVGTQDYFRSGEDGRASTQALGATDNAARFDPQALSDPYAYVRRNNQVTNTAPQVNGVPLAGVEGWRAIARAPLGYRITSGTFRYWWGDPRAAPAVDDGSNAYQGAWALSQVTDEVTQAATVVSSPEYPCYHRHGFLWVEAYNFQVSPAGPTTVDVFIRTYGRR